MKRRIATVTLAVFAIAAGALSLRGQFFGSIVFDPSVYGKVVEELVAMGKQLDQLPVM